MISDCPEQLLLVLAVEGRLSDQHLVQENPVGPPVHRLVVRLIMNDLRGGMRVESSGLNECARTRTRYDC